MSNYDGPALPVLVDVMRAAGAHDAEAARAGCDAALGIIGDRGPHKARPDIVSARDAAEKGEWRTCWGRAYQAMCGLTHAFPPDLSTCPPAPGAQPLRATTCGCGTDLRAGVRFCHSCGTPVRD